MFVCSMMHQERERVKADPGLSSVFIDPTTGHIWNEVILYIKKIINKIINYNYWDTAVTDRQLILTNRGPGQRLSLVCDFFLIFPSFYISGSFVLKVMQVFISDILFQR